MAKKTDAKRVTKKKSAKTKTTKKSSRKKPVKKVLSPKEKEAEQKINKRKLKKEIEDKAKQISESDVEDLLKREEEIEKKLIKVPKTFGKFINQLKLLIEMLKDYWNGTYKETPWYSIAMAATSIIYFLSPIDIIPDFLPIIGYVDDVMVVGMVIWAIREDLKKYCEFKGYNLDEFF